MRRAGLVTQAVTIFAALAFFAVAIAWIEAGAGAMQAQYEATVTQFDR